MRPGRGVDAWIRPSCARVVASAPRRGRGSSGAGTPHRFYQRRAYGFVDERRQLLGPDPTDLVMFIGGGVCRCPLPLVDDPGAEAYGFFSAAYLQLTQMGRRACCYLHAQFLVHLPGERSQFCLACLDVSAGQVPNVRVDMAVWTSVDEQNLTFANQRRSDDLVHGRDCDMTIRQERPRPRRRRVALTLGFGVLACVLVAISGPTSIGWISRGAGVGVAATARRRLPGCLKTGSDDEGAPPACCLATKSHALPEVYGGKESRPVIAEDEDHPGRALHDGMTQATP